MQQLSITTPQGAQPRNRKPRFSMRSRPSTPQERQETGEHPRRHMCVFTGKLAIWYRKRKSNRGGRSADNERRIGHSNTVSCARCALCFHSSSTVSSGPLISVLDQSASFRTLPINYRPPAHRSCSHIALVEEQVCMELGASPSNTALKLHSRAVVPLCRLDHCRGSMRC